MDQIYENHQNHPVYHQNYPTSKHLEYSTAGYQQRDIIPTQNWNYLTPHHNQALYYPPVHPYPAPPTYDSQLPSMANFHPTVPNSYQFHNQYHGFYYNHHGNPVDIYSRYYQYNLPVTQVATPKDYQYQQIHPQPQHQPQEYHTLTPITPVDVPMETVIKPATEVEEQEPTLCEILTKAENSRRSLEEQQDVSFSLDMANVSLVDAMSYMPVLDEVSADETSLKIDIPDPQITFIYEISSETVPDESLKAVKEEKTPERVDEPVIQYVKLECDETIPPKTPVKRLRKRIKVENGDLMEPKMISSTDPKVPKKFECVICLKTFNGHSYYAQHYRTRHCGDQQFKCAKCGKKFFDVESLDVHSNNHIMKDYQCTQCSKLFAHKYDLSRHTKTHLTKLPHECGFCSKGFVRRDHMKQHEIRCKLSPEFKMQTRKKYITKVKKNNRRSARKS